MSIRQCPHCKSFSVHRSRRRGWFEYSLSLFLLRPYRCWACDRRHYGSAFKRHCGSPTPPLKVALRPLGEAAQLATLLLLLASGPMLLSSRGYGLRLLDGAAFDLTDNSGLDVSVPTDSESVLRWRTPPPGEVPSHLLAAFVPQREPLGSLRATGEVYINEARVPETATVFPGDTVRTGADGGAALEIPGKGTIIISPRTQISIAGERGYFAKLTEGAVGLRTVGPVTQFQVQIGTFVAIPQPEMENVAADIERAADGAARVKALDGAVGVIDLDGVQTVFISGGEEVTISPEGVLTKVGTVTPSPAPATPQPGPMGGISTQWIALAGAGGGAVAVAAALAGGNGAQPVSPSAP